MTSCFEKLKLVSSYRSTALRLGLTIQNDRGRLGFPVGTSIAIFDTEVTLNLPTKFRVIWPSGSGEFHN